MAQKTDEIQRLKHEMECMRKRYEEKDKFETEILSNHQNNLSRLIVYQVFILKAKKHQILGHFLP